MSPTISCGCNKLFLSSNKSTNPPQNGLTLALTQFQQTRGTGQAQWSVFFLLFYIFTDVLNELFVLYWCPVDLRVCCALCHWGKLTWRRLEQAGGPLFRSTVRQCPAALTRLLLVLNWGQTSMFLSRSFDLSLAGSPLTSVVLLLLVWFLNMKISILIHFVNTAVKKNKKFNVVF